MTEAVRGQRPGFQRNVFVKTHEYSNCLLVKIISIQSESILENLCKLPRILTVIQELGRSDICFVGISSLAQRECYKWCPCFKFCHIPFHKRVGYDTHIKGTYLTPAKLRGWKHYTDVIMGAIASQITSLTIVYTTVYSDADQRKHQSSASLAFVWGIQRGPVNSPHKWPVTRKIFPFDDVIMAF